MADIRNKIALLVMKLNWLILEFDRVAVFRMANIKLGAILVVIRTENTNELPSERDSSRIENAVNLLIELSWGNRVILISPNRSEAAFRPFLPRHVFAFFAIQ